MDDQDVLQQLLKVEKEAADLVLDAQKAADERIAASERAFRGESEKRYALRLGELEPEYRRKLEALDQECRNEVDAYQATLDALPLHQRQFEELALSLLSERD